MRFIPILGIILYWTASSRANITICKRKVPEFPLSYTDIQNTIKDFGTGGKDIHVRHLPFTFTHPAVRVAGEVDDVTVSNVYNYTLEKLQVIDDNHLLIFNITFHNILVDGYYDMTGNVGELFEIFGKGDFRFQMINFNVAATMEFPPFDNGTAICVTSNVDVSMQQVKSHFYNLMGDPELEELMNDAIESLAPEIVQILWGEAKENNDDTIKRIIEDIINGSQFMGVTSHILQATIQHLKQLRLLPGINNLFRGHY